MATTSLMAGQTVTCLSCLNPASLVARATVATSEAGFWCHCDSWALEAMLALNLGLKNLTASSGQGSGLRLRLRPQVNSVRLLPLSFKLPA